MARSVCNYQEKYEKLENLFSSFKLKNETSLFFKEVLNLGCRNELYYIFLHYVTSEKNYELAHIKLLECFIHKEIFYPFKDDNFNINHYYTMILEIPYLALSNIHLINTYFAKLINTFTQYIATECANHTHIHIFLEKCILLNTNLIKDILQLLFKLCNQDKLIIFYENIYKCGYLSQEKLFKYLMSIKNGVQLIQKLWPCSSEFLNMLVHKLIHQPVPNSNYYHNVVQYINASNDTDLMQKYFIEMGTVWSDEFLINSWSEKLHLSATKWLVILNTYYLLMGNFETGKKLILNILLEGVNLHLESSMPFVKDMGLIVMKYVVNNLLPSAMEIDASMLNPNIELEFSELLKPLPSRNIQEIIDDMTQFEPDKIWDPKPNSQEGDSTSKFQLSCHMSEKVTYNPLILTNYESYLSCTHNVDNSIYHRMTKNIAFLEENDQNLDKLTILRNFLYTLSYSPPDLPQILLPLFQKILTLELDAKSKENHTRKAILVLLISRDPQTIIKHLASNFFSYPTAIYNYSLKLEILQLIMIALSTINNQTLSHMKYLFGDNYMKEFADHLYTMNYDVEWDFIRSLHAQKSYLKVFIDQSPLIIFFLPWIQEYTKYRDVNKKIEPLIFGSFLVTLSCILDTFKNYPDFSIFLDILLDLLQSQRVTDDYFLKRSILNAYALIYCHTMDSKEYAFKDERLLEWLLLIIKEEKDEKSLKFAVNITKKLQTSTLTHL